MIELLFSAIACRRPFKPATARSAVNPFLFCFTFVAQTASAGAIVDCSMLDPRIEVSSATEGKIQGSADTLYKIAKAEGKVEGKVETEAKNVQNNVPQSEKSNVQNRLLYVFCEMFAKDPSLPAERKFELYKIVLDRFVPPASEIINPPAKPPKPPLDDDEQAKQAAADRAAAERAAKSAATDRAAVEKMLSRKKEEIAAAKRAALAAIDAERAKRESSARDAKAAAERADAKKIAAERLKSENLLKTFSALQAGRPILFHTSHWHEGLKDLQFHLRFEKGNLILSEIQFSLDLDAPVSKKYKDAIDFGARFALYFGLYNQDTKQFFGLDSICCWSDRNLIQYKLGHPGFTAKDRSIVLKNAKDVTNAEALLSNRILLYIYFIPVGMKDGNGGSESILNVLNMAIEDTAQPVVPCCNPNPLIFRAPRLPSSH